VSSRSASGTSLISLESLFVRLEDTGSVSEREVEAGDMATQSVQLPESDCQYLCEKIQQVSGWVMPYSGMIMKVQEAAAGTDSVVPAVLVCSLSWSWLVEGSYPSGITGAGDSTISCWWKSRVSTIGNEFAATVSMRQEVDSLRLETQRLQSENALRQGETKVAMIRLSEMEKLLAAKDKDKTADGSTPSKLKSTDANGEVVAGLREENRVSLLFAIFDAKLQTN
jgi:hypothetical protein